MGISALSFGANLYQCEMITASAAGLQMIKVFGPSILISLK